jgi:succinate dehydrogenase / fumarate reductase flavoprotein subunit
MGGIDVDINHKTNIDSLYAIGECASIYHGANRLGGNSILGALVGGYVVGNNLALEDIENNEFDVINYNKKLLNKYKNKELVDILINSLGIVRDEKTLKDGLKKLDELKEIDIEHLNLAKAFILSALNRCECRGAHYRNDYQIKNDKPKQTIASFDKDVIITNR